MAAIAARPCYGGGIHLAALAELVGRRAGDPQVMAAVWQARQMDLVDVSMGYVIAEVRRRDTPPLRWPP